MNILLVHYGDLLSNSITHIHPYATAFQNMGCSCVLSIADDSPSTEHTRSYKIVRHKEIDSPNSLFPNNFPADIVHAWTPRENVRRATERYCLRFPSSKMIIHLEDNEEEIMETCYQQSIERLCNPLPGDRQPQWKQRLAHPVYYKRFLAKADAITLLVPSLERLLPVEKLTQPFTPVLDFNRELQNTPKNTTTDAKSFKRKYKIDIDTRLIAFPGGVTDNNREDIINFYTAVNLLNQEGTKALIVKTGPHCRHFDTTIQFPLTRVEIDLGFIDEDTIPDLLRISDCLVQPGKKTPFNIDRFPCKIPEFLASGTPSVLPAFYTGINKIPSDCCVTLSSSSPKEIANKIKFLFDNPQHGQQLAKSAQEYARSTYSLSPNVESILKFYRKVRNIDQMGSGFPRAQPSTKRFNPLKKLWYQFKKRRRPHSESTSERCLVAEPPGHLPSYTKTLPLRDEQEKAYVLDFKNRLRKGTMKCPKISILLPVFETEEKWLRRCIDSVIEQAYENWELCISDDNSKAEHIRTTIDSYLQIDPRIKATFLELNSHISVATNTAFSLATGEYIALLDHDDELSRQALAKVVDAIDKNPQAKIIYSDEDKIDVAGSRFDPHFKSDWNYELFLGCNMICHLGVYKRDAFEKAGGFRQGYEGAQDWDLALRLAETASSNEIVHIPEILYHWRTLPSSTASNINSKSYAINAQRKTIESHLERVGSNAIVENVNNLHWRVRYPLPTPEPQVSIIVPTRDRTDLLIPCVKSIFKNTIYSNYQVIIVDNNSENDETKDYLNEISKHPKVKILQNKGNFNYSRINNEAIRNSEAEIICLLNNDTEIIAQEWLAELVSHAIRPGIGVVGAKLLFPHEHVQHCGVIMGLGGIANHAFKFLHREDYGYFHRAQITSTFSAVTGACMAFEKRLWTQLDGLDEENLPIAFNDIDFCLRAGAIGQRTILTPFALLFHNESSSREPDSNPDNSKRFEKETNYMKKKWEGTIKRDPYYNPNLSKDQEGFKRTILCS